MAGQRIERMVRSMDDSSEQNPLTQRLQQVLHQVEASVERSRETQNRLEGSAPRPVEMSVPPSPGDGILHLVGLIESSLGTLVRVQDSVLSVL